MSCLDVMYQVYAPPQPYFTPTYSPYHHHHHPHHQKLAFYSKMQEEPASGGNSFSNVSAATIKEEECAPEKEQPPEAEYINSRCVLFTYFQGDISSVVDEHFSRALSQTGSYGPGSAGGNKSTRVSSTWKDGSFPMSQRSFPPSFWNSAYQPAAAASLSGALGAPHTDLPFPADPYSSASLHGHLHQAAPDSWHATHHHHHAYPLGGAIGAQGSAYSRASVHDVYGTHFDPRYGSLLVPSVRPHRLAPATVPAPGPSPCDLGKSEPASSAWTGTFSGTGSDMALNVDAGPPQSSIFRDQYTTTDDVEK